MSVISIKGFGGLKPMTDPILLDTADATVAENVRLMSGALVPLAGTTDLKSLGIPAANTIFRYGYTTNEQEHWLEFAGVVDIIRSPIAGDPYERIYWTDGVQPKYAINTQILSGAIYPGAYYHLGIEAPATVPVISGSIPDEASDTETRTYVYTYVTEYGEEGPPSNAAIAAAIDPAQPVYVSNLSSPSAPMLVSNITKIRLYRSSTVGSAASWQFTAELPVGQTTFEDTVGQADLGELLQTDDWVAPPAGLQGLKMMTASGSAVGFVGNTVYMSEPASLHAWPYQYPIDDQIIGIGVFRQSVVVLTTGYPYLLSGVDPQLMSLEKMELPQACLSKRSIVDTGEGTMYASPDGLVSIGASGVNVVTNNLMTRAQWQELNPSSFVSYAHDGRYHAFYEKTDGTRGVLIIDFSGQGATLTTSSMNTGSPVRGAYVDPRTDTMYLSQGGKIKRWNTGANMVYTWMSKIFRLPNATPFSCASIDAEAYPVTLSIYADGEWVATHVATDNRAFRLPGGFRSQDWQFKLESSFAVTRFRVAHSMVELKAAV